MDLCRWSAGPTSWATSCVTVESNLSFFFKFSCLVKGILRLFAGLYLGDKLPRGFGWHGV